MSVCIGLIIITILILDKTIWRVQRNNERREHDKLHGR